MRPLWVSRARALRVPRRFPWVPQFLSKDIFSSSPFIWGSVPFCTLKEDRVGYILKVDYDNLYGLLLSTREYYLLCLDPAPPPPLPPFDLLHLL